MLLQSPRYVDLQDRLGDHQLYNICSWSTAVRPMIGRVFGCVLRAEGRGATLGVRTGATIDMAMSIWKVSIRCEYCVDDISGKWDV